jgi:hypothetical protein
VKILPTKKITARRHELFEVFAAKSLDVVKDDAAAACKLAETALKALSGPEHEPVYHCSDGRCQPLLSTQQSRSERDRSDIPSKFANPPTHSCLPAFLIKTFPASAFSPAALP